MADKGYPISKFLIWPFSNNDLTNNPQVALERKQWNKAFSSNRATVEHAFGLLKGRFSALRSMPGWDLSRMYRAIEALMIIHNICIDLRDDIHNIEQVNPVDEQAGNIGHLIARDQAKDADALRASGLVRQKQLVDFWAQARN
ncbi:hypothetical protein RSOLAG22IIIB_05701 [Rhizoctonia solani]|uniref:DDE Tnp4 domain-containing protein n=1 Tax=Rhizoctonia solani TaxID=456999 RepID=A0A0K6G8G1_9AGAM|nr:hypothetical protein RSOLAG22IIIB_05701 [Rhizoctonia solani]